MEIAGSCHCGNIGFVLTWLPDPEIIQARVCSCSFCIRHGAVWTSCPSGSLDIRVGDESGVSNYVFGTKTARFLVCSVCGIVPVALSRLDGKDYAVVNVNTFAGMDRSRIESAPISFDSEDIQTRLSRRRKNWIANVRFNNADR